LLFDRSIDSSCGLSFPNLDDKRVRGLAVPLNFVRSARAPKSNAKFSGAGEWRTYVSVKASPFL
jgi:hypothetical protein